VFWRQVALGSIGQPWGLGCTKLNHSSHDPPMGRPDKSDLTPPSWSHKQNLEILHASVRKSRRDQGAGAQNSLPSAVDASVALFVPVAGAGSLAWTGSRRLKPSLQARHSSPTPVIKTQPRDDRYTEDCWVSPSFAQDCLRSYSFACICLP